MHLYVYKTQIEKSLSKEKFDIKHKIKKLGFLVKNIPYVSLAKTIEIQDSRSLTCTLLVSSS